MSRAKLFGMAVLWLFTTQAICLVTISLHDQWVEAHKPNPCDSPDVVCVKPYSPNPWTAPTVADTGTLTFVAGTTKTLTLPEFVDMKSGTAWIVDGGTLVPACIAPTSTDGMASLVPCKKTGASPK